MNGFNKGKSEKTLKEKKKKLNGKEAVQCQPVAWEEFQQKKESEQARKENNKYEWDRPLVEESWEIDEDVRPVRDERAKRLDAGRPEQAVKEPKQADAVSEFEQNIINSTIMEDEFLFIETARAKSRESIYDKYAKEDRKIIIQSEELKHKKKSENNTADGKKIRRRVPKGTVGDWQESPQKAAKRDRIEKQPYQTAQKQSKFRERSADWQDADENRMLDGEGFGMGEAFKDFFGSFGHFTPLQWATLIMAAVIFLTGITTTAVYANYQSEQNKAIAVASLNQFEKEETQTEEVATTIEEELPTAAEEPEEATGKVLSLVLTSVEKDLKIKLVDDEDTLVKGVLWGVTVTDADGKTSENEDDDEDGIIHLTEVSAGDYSVKINPSDALAGYVLPSEGQSVSVKAKVEYKVIQNIKDEIKTEKEVNAAVEDANGNQAADVETGTALTDTVEWVESTKTANGESYVESEVVLTNTAKAADKENAFVAALNVIKEAAKTGISPDRMMAYTVLLTSGDAGSLSENNITINKPSIEIEVGGSETLTSNTDKEETANWSSLDTSIATVDNTGAVKGIAAGTTTIIASISNGKSASCTVTVKAKAEPASITVSPTTASVAVGGTVTLTAIPKPDGTAVSWKSGDESIATVSNGVVTGKKAGTVTITATGKDNVQATCSVTVTEAAGVSISASTASVAVGATTALTATATPSGNTVTWSTSDPSIASITASGTSCTVKGVKAGTATITVKEAKGGKTATCTVTVSDASVTLSGTASVAVGSTTAIKAAVVPSTATVTWKISDTNLATITTDGLTCTVKGVKAGSVVLTATGSNGKTATLTITVTGDKYADGAQLYDKDKNALYVYENNAYRLAKYADYKSGKFSKYYKKLDAFLYTGWQTIEGKTYYYKKDNTYVTGEQIIAGVKYNFATDGSLTQGSGTLGIDVSKYQPSINWSSVKSSGISYAIIRCGYRGSSTGALIQDPYFVSHIKGAKAAGLKVGVYFFTTALTEAEAVEEASMCAALCSGYGINYPVFMDVESSNRPGFNSMSASQRTAIIKAFCNTVRSAGYTPGVYANKTWLTSYMNASELSGYKIWLAQYNAGGPTYSGRYDLWQYTSKGSVNGISGNVDMNQSYLGY